MEKKFKPHMMYGDGEKEMADTHQEHLDLKEKGYGHSAPTTFKMPGFSQHATASPATFKGANSKNSKCWKGCRKVGTKPSPTRPGVTVNDCDCG
tara:strand:+ start:226 stop:507 length:282 start_codon:yes stop_codon:yes gene_type:complete